MKIKKVEIQAFRAYDLMEDSVFDFSMKNNDIADFISIYAPNGFGKTSFYDAVEWGVTNNISRFLRREKENKLSAKAESKKSTLGKYIFRNKFSLKDTDTFVKLYTDSTEIENVFDHKKLRSTQRDTKFDSDATKKGTEYLLDVILSQDSIDSFLKEDDSFLRYTKFMDSFGDKEVDKKYRVIIDLIKINKSKISDCNKNLINLKKELKSDFDEEILTKINSAIKGFNKNNTKIPLISPSFTEKEDLEFSNALTERTKDIEFKINNLEKKQNLIESTFSNKSEFFYYSINKEKIIKLESEIRELKNIDKLFGKKDELNTKIFTSRKNLNDLEKTKVELEELYKIFSKFIEVKEKIRKVNDKINTFKSKLEGKSFTLSEKIKTLSVEKTKQKSLDGELRSLQEKIENSSNLYQNLALEKTYSISIKNVIEKYKSIVELRDSRVSSQDEKIKNYNHFISIIKNDRYPDLFESDLESLKVKVDEIKSNNLHIVNLKEELETLTIKINENGELNKEIKQLIKLGSDIVSKNKLSNCPLCKKNHGDFSTLAKRISNNPLINNSFNELIKNKSDLENDLRIVKKNVAAIKNDVVSCFESIINVESIELENRRYKLFKSRSKLLEKSKELILIEDRISALTIETNGLENDKFISQLLSEVKSIEAVIANSRADLNTSLESIKAIEKEIALLKTEVDSSQEQLKFLQSNVHYLKVVNYIESVSTVEDFKQDHISDSIFKLMDRIQVCKDEILSLAKQEKIIEEEISDKPLSDFVSIINDKSKLIDNLINFNKHVEQFFSNNFDKDIVKLEITDLHRTLSDESDVIKRDVSVMQMKLIEIEKIKEYKENVIPFLKHQKNYSDYVKYLDNKKFLEEVVSEELKRERRKLSNHIHDNVRSFFHQDLINSLYSKIDPHPKYKKISFECDFSNDKPRLDVFISGESGNIVPTLYFSSAQLNILSLSIFLAKALNVKDDDKNPVNCIFIDDPIQAMDSINILSVIDLFRSIVVNMGKQIILSTHDENFYNLLQKKIPEDLFKSRYIELESFGKVKKEA